MYYLRTKRANLKPGESVTFTLPAPTAGTRTWYWITSNISIHDTARPLIYVNGIPNMLFIPPPNNESATDFGIDDLVWQPLFIVAKPSDKVELKAFNNYATTNPFRPMLLSYNDAAPNQ